MHGCLSVEHSKSFSGNFCFTNFDENWKLFSEALSILQVVSHFECLASLFVDFLYFGCREQ